jgi:hypothetical protein
VAINQSKWLKTNRTDHKSWETYTEDLNGDLEKAVDHAKKFAQSERFKTAYIKLKNIRPRYSCYEVTEHIASQLKKGVCGARIKAVRYKENKHGIAIRFMKDSTREQAAFNAQYQLWPDHIIGELRFGLQLRSFVTEYVFGMMHHSVGTERAVKAGKRDVRNKSQMKSSTLGLHAVNGSARQGQKYEVARDISINRGRSAYEGIRFKVDGTHLGRFDDNQLFPLVLLATLFYLPKLN